MQRASQRGVQVGPVGGIQAQRAVQRDDQRRAASAQAKAANPFNAAFEAKRQMEGGGKDKGGSAGIGGLLSKVLKPTELLDYGRRAVHIGLEQTAEALPTPLEFLAPLSLLVDEDRTKADKRSIREQFFDPTYGSGQILHQLHTGNELVDRWGNRAIGAIGDIALDPLTYLTLGSAKIPGATGRVALAKTAQSKGLSREVIEAAGRLGAQGVRNLGDDAAIKALDIAQPGLRFGTRKASVRLPGTGALEEALSGALNKVRGPLTDTKLAATLRKGGASRNRDTRVAVEQLLTGKGPLGAREAATHILLNEAENVGKRTTAGLLGNMATKIGDELGDEATYTHMVEMGDLSHPGAARLAGLQDEAFQWETNTGKWDPATNPNAPRNFASVGHRENRLPRVPTAEGREVFGIKTNVGPGGASIQPGAQQYSRVIVPGVDAKGQPLSYTIRDAAGNGGDFVPVDGTIKEANDWAASVNLPKLYEDSPRKLAAVTVEQAEHAVGEARKFHTLEGLRITDPNDPTKTVPGGSSTTGGVATKQQLSDDLSKAAGEARAQQLQPEMERRQAKTAGGKAWLDQTGSDIVANLTRENQIMLDIATDLDDEARAALTAANKAMRKVSDPNKAIQNVYAEADRQIKKATDGLARSQKKLDDVIERQRQLELGNRRARAGVHRSLKAERTRLEAEVADATEVLRARDAMGAKLRRTIKREGAEGARPRVDIHETRRSSDPLAEQRMEGTLGEPNDRAPRWRQPRRQLLATVGPPRPQQLPAHRPRVAPESFGSETLEGPSAAKVVRAGDETRRMSSVPAEHGRGTSRRKARPAHVVGQQDRGD